ncbi:Peptidase C25, gingipain domain protein, partial [Candidatus Thiomargarita nelsonii]
RTTRDTNCSPLPPAIKLSIDKTGVYALSHADFLALGLDLSLLNAKQVSQIQMTHQGHPVSIFIAGEDDGVFGSDDVLFFYAQAAKGPYTRNNIYWLSLNPNGGKRLNFKDGTPKPSYPQLSEFTQTVHVETNSRYWSRMPDSINRDRLFWKKLDAGNSLEMPVTLQHLAQTSKDATLRVMLQGKTDDRATNPNHHTKILLNDVEIHDAQWSGQQIFLQEVSIPQTKLLEGKNTVTLLSVGDTGATVDILYVNWLEIDYTATMTAVEDHLTFKLTGVEQYNLTINGFTRSDLLVLDVTNPFNIVPLLGATVSGAQIQYADQLDGNKTYYAFSFADKHLLKPAAMSLDLPTTRLESPCNQADYFIIYHDSFDTKALENLIAARGKKVMAVQVSDIYDEFNHGLPEPQAIKDFLTYAYENYTQPRPAYVLLVGDANQDTLNELGDGINYVPTHTFHTFLMGETASDNWFVSVSGDDPLPDMFLGRIPVKTQAELDAVVKKLTSYPKVPLDGWEQNVLFVADDIAEFEEVSDQLIEKYLANYSPTRIYLSEYTEDEKIVTQDISQAINAGAVLTNYTGHGSVNLWAG